MAGGGSTKSVTTVQPPAFAVPFFTDFLARSSIASNQPKQPFEGQRTAGLNPIQLAGLQATTDRAINGSQEIDQARDQLGQTLNGGFLGVGPAVNPSSGLQNPFFGSNPFLQGQIDQASNDVIRNFQTAVKPSLDAAQARSGSFGNSGLQEVERLAQSDLQRNLGDISSNFRFQDFANQQQLGENSVNRAFQAGESLAGRADSAFQNERQRQLSAIGLAPSLANQDFLNASALSGVGDVFQRQTQAGIDDQRALFSEKQNAPLEALGLLGQALGLNFGQTSTSQGPSGGNPINSGLGGAATGAAIGSVIPGLGTGIGAGVGGALGLLGGK